MRRPAASDMVVKALGVLLSTMAVLRGQDSVKASAGVEILEPATWIHKGLPIIGHIDVREALSQGIRVVVLHDHTCANCVNAMPKVRQIAEALRGNEDALRLVWIDLPPYASRSPSEELPCIRGRLSSDRDWVLDTPVTILLSDGRVEYVWEQQVPDLEQVVERVAAMGRDHDSNRSPALIPEEQGRPSVAQDRELIRAVNLSGPVLDVKKNQTVEIRYELVQPARITVRLWDCLGREVRTLVENRALQQGIQASVWDGRDRRGEFVPNEAYTFSIEAQDESGHAQTYDPAVSSGGQVRKPMSIMIPRTGWIRYTLDRPARVRIRTGVLDAAMLREIVGWAPRPAGVIAERWDGKDPSGLMDLASAFSNAKIGYAIEAFSLPDQAVIVRGSRDMSWDDFLALGSVCGPSRSLPPCVAGHRCATHSRQDCRPPRFSMVWPQALSDTPRSQPIPAATMPLEVRIRTDQADDGLTVSWFVDGMPMDTDMDMHPNPSVLTMDTEALTEGMHVLTVNVEDRLGHVATQSRYVEVSHGSKEN